jgi:hypothetical protein
MLLFQEVLSDERQPLNPRFVSGTSYFPAQNSRTIFAPESS